ncbi:hypothetical protein KBI23_04890 [bacterium]|nr:hypothetical protein [bacterium]MBP9807231.1 hypothetical protein [bacterium]
MRRDIFTAVFVTGLITLAAASATYANVQAPAAKVTVATTNKLPEKPVKTDDLTREIRAYEHKYFERNFESESDDQRLNRLENFIFGATNSGDAAHRTAQIIAAVGLPSELQPKAAETTTTTTTTHTNQNTKEPTSDQSPGHYPRVTALETAILGQSYQTDAISTRLNRMELKAFGAQSNSSDLSARTDALDQYAEVKLHVKPENALAVNPRMSTRMDGQVPSAAAGNLGTFEANPFVRGLRSVASDLNPVNSIATSSATSSYSADEDDDPAAEARKEMIEQQLIDAAKPNAPSSHERTLSRVAWCEMQLFGKSFPQLHLLQRLHQLNANLFPQDKEKDIQLMDRIDIIVKEVVLRKHPPA